MNSEVWWLKYTRPSAVNALLKLHQLFVLRLSEDTHRGAIGQGNGRIDPCGLCLGDGQLGAASGGADDWQIGQLKLAQHLIRRSRRGDAQDWVTAISPPAPANRPAQPEQEFFVQEHSV